MKSLCLLGGWSGVFDSLLVHWWESFSRFKPFLCVGYIAQSNYGQRDRVISLVACPKIRRFGSFDTWSRLKWGWGFWKLWLERGWWGSAGLGKLGYIKRVRVVFFTRFTVNRIGIIFRVLQNIIGFIFRWMLMYVRWVEKEGLMFLQLIYSHYPSFRVYYLIGSHYLSSRRQSLITKTQTHGTRHFHIQIYKSRARCSRSCWFRVCQDVFRVSSRSYCWYYFITVSFYIYI